MAGHNRIRSLAMDGGSRRYAPQRPQLSAARSAVIVGLVRRMIRSSAAASISLEHVAEGEENVVCHLSFRAMNRPLPAPLKE